MEKLNQIIDRCKCGIEIRINEHLNYYENVGEYLRNSDLLEVEEDTISNMVKNNSVVVITMYPDTPVAFHTVYHYKLSLAIDEAIKFLTEKE